LELNFFFYYYIIKEMAKAANRSKTKELKWANGNILELTISPTPKWKWDVLKGEAVQDEWEICKKQSLNNSKGLEVGRAEHKCSARLVSDSVTGKIYLTGECYSIHKITKNGKQYIVDTIQTMDQEVAFDKEVATNATFVGEPDFYNLRVKSCTRDDIPLTHVVSKPPTNEHSWWIMRHHIIFPTPDNHFMRLPSWYRRPVVRPVFRPFIPIPPGHTILWYLQYVSRLGN
jgi:hypothetical protein